MKKNVDQNGYMQLLFDVFGEVVSKECEERVKVVLEKCNLPTELVNILTFRYGLKSGNMATITFDLSVQKKTTVDESMNNLTTGLIPMTNSMVQKAVNNASTKGICVDDNGNAVCQVYKIILNIT